MSRNIKTTFKAFDYMHCDDFARYLSEMAAKGWHFKEWGAGLKFEKGEPAQVKYAVEVFTKASENDLRPEPNTQEFAEYCEKIRNEREFYINSDLEQWKNPDQKSEITAIRDCSSVNAGYIKFNGERGQFAAGVQTDDRLNF